MSHYEEFDKAGWPPMCWIWARKMMENGSSVSTNDVITWHDRNKSKLDKDKNRIQICPHCKDNKGKKLIHNTL